MLPFVRIYFMKAQKTSAVAGGGRQFLRYIIWYSFGLYETDSVFLHGMRIAVGAGGCGVGVSMCDRVITYKDTRHERKKTRIRCGFWLLLLEYAKKLCGG